MSNSNELKEKREIAQSEALDKTAKIIAGMFPMGSAAYEVITTIVVPLHEKKKREFINDLASRLKRLEENDKIDFDELSENEEFNTIITKAILLAQQNHQKQKLEALRAIVVNSALNLNDSTDMFDWAERFLYIVDRISPFHILLLKTFKSPAVSVENKSADLKRESMMSSKELFFMIYPEHKDRVMLISQCWNELINFGLVNDQSFEKIIHTHNLLKKLTNDFGDKFLGMIEAEE